MPHINGRPRLLKSMSYRVHFGMYQTDNNGRFPNLNSCITQAPGMTDDLQKVIAGQHSMMQSEFESIVGEFFFPDHVPFPEIRSRIEMENLIQQAGNNKIAFIYDEKDKSTNNIKTIAGDPNTVMPYYSAYLFKGILLLYPQISEFHFYKAIDNGKYTVAIVAVNNNDILYLGELSELYP